jgi:ethanolamine utilization protein EutP (predicted NTPase)
MKTITSKDGFEYKTVKSKNSKVIIKKVEVKIPSVSFSENIDTIVVVKGNITVTYHKEKQTVRKVSKISSFYSKTGRETNIEILSLENISVQNAEDLLQYI